MACVRFMVRGRVQGVFFRASTREQALKLGVSGHAKNLADGGVEVLASGSPEALDALHKWLHVGPPSARVRAPTGADSRRCRHHGHDARGPATIRPRFPMACDEWLRGPEMTRCGNRAYARTPRRSCPSPGAPACLRCS